MKQSRAKRRAASVLKYEKQDRCNVIKAVASVGTHDDREIADKRAPEILTMLNNAKPTVGNVFAAIRHLRKTPPQ